VTGGQYRLFPGLVFRVGEWVGHRVVPVILLLTFLIRAGLCLCFGFGVTGPAVRPKSGCHKQSYALP